MAISDKLDNGRKKKSKYQRRTCHSKEGCYAQKSDMEKSGKLDSGGKKWCNKNTTVEAIRMTEKYIVNVRKTIFKEKSERI